MNKFFKIIEQLYVKKVPAEGLAIFRICYGLVLLFEILQLIYFRNLIFDPIPFIEYSELNYAPVFTLWLIAIILFILGLFTQYVTVINFLMTTLTFSVFTTFEYHLDWSYIGVNFLLMFLPVSTTLSLDRLIKKLKHSTLKADYIPSKLTSHIYYYLPVFIGIGLVYFDSVFWKLASPIWLNGLGFWYPTSMAQNTYLDLSPILNLKYLSIFLGYLTLIFEIVFLFLIWFKKFKIPLLIIGVSLHLGIFFAYPIPLFALGITGIYLLLIPPTVWVKIFNNFKSKPSLLVYYNAENIFHNRARIIFQHFDILNKITFSKIQTDTTTEAPGSRPKKDSFGAVLFCINNKKEVYYGIEAYSKIFKKIWFLYPIGILLQIALIFQKRRSLNSEIANKKHLNTNPAGLPEETPKITIPDSNDIKLFPNLTYSKLKLKIICFFIVYCLFSQLMYVLITSSVSIAFNKVGLHYINYKIHQAFNPINNLNKRLLGISNHGVFLDYHFIGYNHIIAIVYKGKDGVKEWLPIITETGQTSYYNTGKQWAKWTWRINGPKINQDELNKGIERFTSFWAAKRNVPLESATFEILVKKVDVPEYYWQENFLRTQMKKPWIKAGEVHWQNKKFESNIINIESI